MMQSTQDLQLLSTCAAVTLYYLVFFFEWHRYRMNLKALTFIGIKTRAKLPYALYYILAASFPILATIAWFVSDHPEVSKAEFVAGGTILFFSQMLRNSAIAHLGNGWVMAYCWEENWQKVTAGPFRWLKDPEYYSRVADAIGFSLIFSVTRELAPLIVILIASTSLLTRLEHRAMSSNLTPMTLSKAD